MTELVLQSIARGNTLQLSLSLDDSFNPTADYSSAQLWFYGKQDPSDSDADAVIALTNGVGGGIVQTGTRKENVLVTADDVAASLGNYDLNLHCALKIRTADGFETDIARGTLVVLASIAPHD